MNYAKPFLRISTYPGTEEWEVRECAVSNLKRRPFCPNPGSVSEVWFTLLNYLNIEYELKIYKEGHFGDFINGNESVGMFGDLLNGRIDTLGLYTVVKPSRLTYFSFSYPTGDDTMMFVMKSPQPDIASNASLLFDVFGSKIWIALLICFVVFLTVKIVGLLFPKIGDSFTHYVSSTLFFSTFGFAAVLFINLYVSGLLPELVDPLLIPVVHNNEHLIEMVAAGKITVITAYKGDFLDNQLNESNDTYFKNLRKALEKNPILYEPNTTKALELVITGKYVYTTFSNSFNNLRQIQCGIAPVPGKDFPRYSEGLMFRRNFSLLPLINHGLVDLHTLHQRIKKRYARMVELKSAEHCASFDEKKPAVPLSVMALAGAFGFFIILSLLSSCVLLSEFAVSKYQEKMSDAKVKEGLSTENRIANAFVTLYNCKKFGDKLAEKTKKYNFHKVNPENWTSIAQTPADLYSVIAGVQGNDKYGLLRVPRPSTCETVFSESKSETKTNLNSM